MNVKRTIDSIAVHCAYTPPNMDIGAATIDRWHKDRGFTGIGYHFVIRRNGSMEQGRPLRQPGAHVQGHNARSIGICLIGGKAAQADLPEMNFTNDQFAALRCLLEHLTAHFPQAAVMGHRDYPGVTKACPCFDVASWWKGAPARLPDDPPREDFWPGIDFFRPAEFKRPMHPEFVRLLDRARRAAGVPFRIERACSDREALVRVRL